MEWWLLLTTVLAAILSACADRIKARFKKAGKNAINILAAIIALTAFVLSSCAYLENEESKDLSKYAIRISLDRSLEAFGSPLAQFYSDYNDTYTSARALDRFSSPDVVNAMQALCFFDIPKGSRADAETWGEVFARGTRLGSAELKQAISLYRGQMTPQQKLALDDVLHDPLVTILSERSDFSSEKNSALIRDGSCLGLTPIGIFKGYVDHLTELRRVAGYEPTR